VLHARQIMHDWQAKAGRTPAGDCVVLFQSTSVVPSSRDLDNAYQALRDCALAVDVESCASMAAPTITILRSSHYDRKLACLCVQCQKCQDAPQQATVPLFLKTQVCPPPTATWTVPNRPLGAALWP